MHQKYRLSSAARWVAVALAVFFPFAAHALGLGKLTVRSALNEPLNAEIEISSIEEKELKGLQVGLASSSDFEQSGVERLPFLSDVKFTVSKRADGNYFVQLNTDRQIEEPFLHLLLAVEWPGGRIVREYTALIDPPVQALGKPSDIEVPAAAPILSPAQAPEQPKPEPVVNDEPKQAIAPVIEKPEVQPQSQPTPEPDPIPPKAVDAAPTEQPLSAPPMMASQPPTMVEPKVEPKPAAELESPSPKSTMSASSTPSVAKGWAMEGGYNVKWGDTAWRIAEQLRGDSQTIEQVVLALYRANPQAFFGNNVNNLKSGQILKIPEGTQIESVAPAQARTQFRAQYDAWQEYKIKLAGASSAIKVVDNEPKQPVTQAPNKEPATAKKEPEQKKDAEAKKELEPKKEESNIAKAPPTQKGAQQEDLLKIVRSTLQGEKTTPDKKPAEGEAAKGAREQQALADRVTTLEESLVSKQNETKEIGDKVAQVRAQLKRESRLIQIEQQQLAQTQDKGKTPEPSPKAEPVKSEPTPKAEPAAPTPKAEPPKAVTPPPVATPAPQPTPTKVPVAAAPKAVPPPPPPPPQAEETSFIDDLAASLLSGDSLLPMVIGGVVLASVVIGLVYMKRRRKSIAEFEESILQSDGVPGTTGEPNLTTDTSGQVVSSGDTSFLSDFSQGGMGNIHTDEVDPIAEAEVYLAYGRDETAEEILKEAVVKNPAREELKLKLLEIYANRSDVRAFETLAEEMYSTMGGRPSKNWPRVEDLGRKLNPNNPMFKGGGASAGAKTPAPASFGDTTKIKAMPATSSDTAALGGAQASGMAASGGAGASDFDFDLEGATPTAVAADRGLDFNIGGDVDTRTAAAEPSLDFSADLATSDDSGLNMDLGTAASGGGVDFDFGEKEELATAAPETEVALEEAPERNTAMPAGDVTEAPQWDETATKLDLARAYIDMGDSEGARSILDEVMSEGNDQQKKQAKELTAQLS